MRVQITEQRQFGIILINKENRILYVKEKGLYTYPKKINENNKENIYDIVYKEFEKKTGINIMEEKGIKYVDMIRERGHYKRRGEIVYIEYIFLIYKNKGVNVGGDYINYYEVKNNIKYFSLSVKKTIDKIKKYIN